MTGASGQRLVERSHHAIGAFREGQQPGVGPQLGGSVILACIFPKSIVDSAGFIDEGHAA